MQDSGARLPLSYTLRLGADRTIYLAANYSTGAALAATLTGALLGASLGEDGMPEEWLADLDSRDEAEHVTASLCKTFGPGK